MSVETPLAIAGLQVRAVGATDAPLTVVLLHGYDMRPSDLAPFAHSIGLPARFLFPRGPLETPGQAHAWWPIDEERRATDLAVGPRDLSEQYPPGLPTARQRLDELLNSLDTRLVIGGFSQGGMLALDWLLHSTRQVDGLALLSSSCLAINEWQPRTERLRNMPVLISHGTRDPDLSFAAGERLRRLVLDAGAAVTWVPFEGAHEIPLVVWRGLRKFVGSLLK